MILWCPEVLALDTMVCELRPGPISREPLATGVRTYVTVIESA
jgi:hypothetical protein